LSVWSRSEGAPSRVAPFYEDDADADEEEEEEEEAFFSEDADELADFFLRVLGLAFVYSRIGSPVLLIGAMLQ
jgi:hypothetical protein